jgi:hypothetical protein
MRSLTLDPAAKEVFRDSKKNKAWDMEQKSAGSPVHLALSDRFARSRFLRPGSGKGCGIE